jgi:hypothetical protein
VLPYLTEWAPLALVPSMPPKVAYSPLEGSGGKEEALSLEQGREFAETVARLAGEGAGGRIQPDEAVHVAGEVDHQTPAQGAAAQAAAGPAGVQA